MEWSLGNFWYILLLLVLPVLGILLERFLKWKNRKKNLFAESRFQGRLFPKESSFTRLFPFLYFLAFLFLIFSIIDLLNGAEEVKTQQKMNNLIFLLDVSNSMNTEDIQPNRLTEAKNLMINALDEMTNDRVGIVIFAGDARSVMPLTTDYTAAENYIDAIETHVIKVQGTDFLKAVETAVEKFKNIPKGSRQIVMISDGEDNENNKSAAIKLAQKEGISIITVGVGSDEGAPIPEYIYGQLMGYKTDINGQTVVSKRQTKALNEIASETGGIYIDGNNLDQGVSQIRSALEKSKTSTKALVRSQNAQHYYQYFLAFSLLLFFMIYLLNPKRDLNI